MDKADADADAQYLCHRATAVVALLLLLDPVVLLAAAAAAAHSSCDWCPRRHSTASLLPANEHLIGGACGFGAAPLELSAAAVTADLFRHGHACGACFQLRCRDRTLCGEDGVKVVVADLVKQQQQQHDDANTTSGVSSLRFLLTMDAFAAMAKLAVSARQLTSLHTLQVDFRRIPCEYRRKKSMAVRVVETSRNPSHLAIQLLYQGGQTDIAAVEIAHANASAMPSSTTWRYLTRRRGGAPAVWSTSRAPPGPLRLRVVVTAGSGGKWMRSDGEVLPADWKAGEVYDTGLRVTDVAARSCSLSCATQDDSDRGDDELR